jgi:uncharacterized membrane protein
MSKTYKNLLAISGGLLATYLLAQGILNVCGLQFRAMINVWWLGITFILFIIGVIQQCIVRKNNKKYEHLEDIYEYTQGKFTTEDLTLADP